MDLQFQKSACSYLRQVTRSVHNEEQTQELKLPEAMPDIGKVLCAWGQCMIRSKEWRKGSMSVSGGVTVYILYQPEAEEHPRSLETWIPFQTRWDFPETQRDGTILISGGVRSVDARTLSARKLMLRVNLSLLGEALVPDEAMLHTPGEIPEDVQLLRRSYMACICAEAGEKAFHLEDQICLQGQDSPMQKVVRMDIQPEIVDRKIMGDKVVFRGGLQVHLLYQCEDGSLHTHDAQIPFSQYSELEREYGENCHLRVIPLISGTETEMQENHCIGIKIGVIGQYVLYERKKLELVEDCYSTRRKVTPSFGELEVPMVLDTCREMLRAETALPEKCRQAVDAAFYPVQPQLYTGEDGCRGELQGQWQLLYREEDGSLWGDTLDWTHDFAMDCGADASLEAWMYPSGSIQLMPQLQNDVCLEGMCVNGKGISMITGMELGEEAGPDPKRPSLILKRYDGEGLWNLAKSTGSTVDSVLSANGLTQEPERGKLLLIPIA